MLLLQSSDRLSARDSCVEKKRRKETRRNTLNQKEQELRDQAAGRLQAKLANEEKRYQGHQESDRLFSSLRAARRLWRQ